VRDKVKKVVGSKQCWGLFSWPPVQGSFCSALFSPSTTTTTCAFDTGSTAKIASGVAMVSMALEDWKIAIQALLPKHS
jgi:hypothetical protein